MSTALERPPPTIRIVGSPGLTSEIAVALLGPKVDLPEKTPSVARGRRLPVVLVDPGPDDWVTALAEGAPVILVTECLLDAAGVADAVLRGADAVVHAGSSPESGCLPPWPNCGLLIPQNPGGELSGPFGEMNASARRGEGSSGRTGGYRL